MTDRFSEPLVDALRHVHVFEDLDDDVRQWLASRMEERVLEAGAEEVSAEAAELTRVESGRPRFGREMGPETMPAEAGIVERAVNFEKGCYIGQEPVARLHYRGRPNRVLRGLVTSGGAEAGECRDDD